MVGTTALIGAGLGLASSIYGAIKSAKKGNEARSLISAQRQKNQRWYDQEMSKDYMNRSDTQAVLKKQKELLDEHYNRSASSAAVMGATDEATAQAKAAANKSLENTMTNIAANSAAHKDSVEQQYQEKDDALNQQQAASYQKQSQQIAKAASQAAKAGLSLVGTAIGTPSAVPNVDPSGQTKPSIPGINENPYDGRPKADKVYNG